MNSLMFCAILSLSSSLAFKVSLHTVNLDTSRYSLEPVLVCTRHVFIYHRGDEFKLYIGLTNNTLDITKALAVVKNSGVKYFGQQFWSKGFQPGDLNELHFQLKSDKLTIDVELSLNNTCVRQRILEGKEVSRALQKGTNITKFKHYFTINDMCSKENPCVVLVDPTTECEDGNLTPLPCEDKRYVAIEIPADDQRSKTANETKMNPETSKAKDDSKEGAEKTYFIIMIVTSITSVVALILLLVIVIRKCCWINNPPGISQILPTINENPFYENVHLRTEFQKEIEELEQREYDVPGESEYVEIDSRSSTK